MKKVKVIPVKWIPENHDVDFDGRPDRKDCKPLDPKKQHQPYGCHQVERNLWGVFAQKLMGASYIRQGKPFFIGTKYECKKYLEQIPKTAEQYDASVSVYQR